MHATDVDPADVSLKNLDYDEKGGYYVFVDLGDDTDEM